MSIPITVAYGDGIGPEIMEAVLSILREIEAKISIEVIEIGETVYNKQWSHGIYDSGWESIERTKLLLKSPTTTPQGKGHKSLNVALRKADIDINSWKWPEIFCWLKEEGKVSQNEMLKTFNCGIGMALIISSKDLQVFKEHFKEQIEVIGKITQI